MARRGENIYKRKDGRWEGRYVKGRKPNGKIIYGYVYDQKYNELKTKLIKYKFHYQHEKIINEYTGSITDFFEFWLQSEAKNRVKDSTFASYQYKVHHYILPYLGKQTFKNISHHCLQNWIHQLSKKKLSAATVRLIVQIFKMCFKYAQKCNYILSDIIEGLVLPKIKKKKMNALTLREQKKLEKEASKKKNAASIVIALYTGMRIGEISALKWTDIDFSKQIIHVKRTTQRIPLKKGTINTQLITQEVKTAESERIIPFSKELKQFLVNLKEKSMSFFVVAIKEKALEPRGITYHFRKILKKINLNHLHFHQLRHTFATRALEIGGDIASISSLLGHHSSKFTMDVYMDSLLHQRKSIMQKLERNFFVNK